MKRIVSEQLEEWQASGVRKPLLLQGARQVGKTYSLQAFGASRFKAHHHINFEEREDLARVFDGDLDPHRIIQDLDRKSVV